MGMPRRGFVSLDWAGFADTDVIVVRSFGFCDDREVVYYPSPSLCRVVGFL